MYLVYVIEQKPKKGDMRIRELRGKKARWGEGPAGLERGKKIHKDRFRRALCVE